MLAEFKSELDDRGVGGAAFLNTRTLMEKLDKVQQNEMNWLDAKVTNFPPYGSESPVLIGNSDTTPAAAQNFTFLFCQNENTAFNVFSNVTENQKRSLMAKNLPRWVCAILFVTGFAVTL